MSSCVDTIKCRKCGARPGKCCKRRLRDWLFGFQDGPLHFERIRDYENLLKKIGILK